LAIATGSGVDSATTGCASGADPGSDADSASGADSVTDDTDSGVSIPGPEGTAAPSDESVDGCGTCTTGAWAGGTLGAAASVRGGSCGDAPLSVFEVIPGFYVARRSAVIDTTLGEPGVDTGL
jgi:hypothetical protein